MQVQSYPTLSQLPYVNKSSIWVSTLDCSFSMILRTTKTNITFSMILRLRVVELGDRIKWFQIFTLIFVILFIHNIKHMRYRCKIEIIALILEHASDLYGIGKTRLMYKTSSNPPMIKKYLSILMENGLIDYRKYERTYTTTEKGEHFLNIYNQIRQLITTQTSWSIVKRRVEV